MSYVVAFLDAFTKQFRRQKIILGKTGRIVKVLEDEFADLQDISEASLRRMWLRKREDVWDRYLKAKIS